MWTAWGVHMALAWGPLPTSFSEDISAPSEPLARTGLGKQAPSSELRRSNPIEAIPSLGFACRGPELAGGTEHHMFKGTSCESFRY
jgi:hypothetical protein